MTGEQGFTTKREFSYICYVRQRASCRRCVQTSLMKWGFAALW